MPGKNPSFGLAIIGGGPGGYVAAIRAAQLGLKTALIEKDKVGGTCLHRGCIPSKALLYSAELYRKLSSAEEYGIGVKGLELRYPQFHRRKESVVKRLFQGVQYLLRKNGVTVLEGEGRISSPNEVSLIKNGTQTDKISAQNILIATGSIPVVPDTIPYDKKFVLTSDDVLNLEEIPETMIIAGGGAIGIEFACLFNTVGTKVTVIELLHEILPSDDKEVGAALKKTLANRGIEFLTGTSLEEVSVDDKDVNVWTKAASTENRKQIKANYLLIALGRTPSLLNLGIEKLSLEFQGKFLKVNETMETSQKGVFAIGDVAGTPFLAHKASREGIMAVSHLTGKEVVPLNNKNIPRVTYGFPQVASIGLTQEEAENGGYKVKVGKFPFSANSKAVIEGEHADGFVKIITDESYAEVLGLHAIGPNVGELIWGISLNSILEGTAFELSRSIFPHPTYSESLLEAAYSAVGTPIHI